MESKIKSQLEEMYSKKTIVIVGLGKEGMSTYHMLRSLNSDYTLYIMDQDVEKVKTFLIHEKDEISVVIEEEKYLKELDQYDVVFKTPGIPGYLLAYADDGRITSQSELFMHFHGANTIGITGTKGKSTTSSIIAYVLGQLGVKVHLIGNIGVPALEHLFDEDDSLYVYELSSFQTEFLQKGPMVGVVLNLFEEHLNNYLGYEDYQNSKLQLFKAMSNEAMDKNYIFGCDNGILKEKVEKLSKKYHFDKVYAFGHYKNCSGQQDGIFLRGDEILRVEKGVERFLCKADFSRKLLGEHNLINSLVAILVVDLLKKRKAIHCSDEEIIHHLSEFKGLPHRLEFVGTYKGVTFYNDSISTIPEATMEAVKAVPELGSLLIGGFDRGIHYEEFSRYLAHLEGIKLIFMPETGHKLFDMMKKNASMDRMDECFLAADMEEAVRLAYEHSGNNKSCLLSPAASSYNKYKNFEERGLHFMELVRSMEVILSKEVKKR